MNNNFVSILLDCGPYDVSEFFRKLDKYEDTVFYNDDDFSYNKLVENVRDNYSDYGLDAFNKELDIMAIESAFNQVESSDEFEELVWTGFNGYYDFSNNYFWFDNVEELKEFDEWEEFANLLKL